MDKTIQYGIEVVDRIDTVKTRLKNQKLDRQTKNVYIEKFKKLKVVSSQLLDKVVKLRSIEKSQMEKHDIDYYQTCDICFEKYQLDNGVLCPKCRQIVCLECYSKIDKCPFCRNILDTVKPTRNTNQLNRNQITRNPVIISQLIDIVQQMYDNQIDRSPSDEMRYTCVLNMLYNNL